MIRVINLNPLKDIPHRGTTTHLVNIFGRLEDREIEFFSFLDNRDFVKGSIKPLKGSTAYSHLIPFGIFEMRRLQPDIILGTGSPYEVLFLLLRPKRTRYVIGWHGPFSEKWILDVGDRSFRSRISFLVAKHLLKKSSLVFCDSEYIKNSFPEEMQKKIFPTSNGVDADFFTPAKRDKKWLQEKLSPASKPVAIFVGHLIRRKRPDLFALLASRIPEIEFVLVGREGFFTEKDVESWQKKAPNLKWVKGLGREDMAKLFASADCLVFPTQDEPFGLTTIEAMASGLPVIATASGATPEILQDGEGGYLISPDKKELDVFDEKIRRVCSLSAGNLAVFTEKSRIRARELFNWGKVADNYMKGFIKVLNAHENSF